MRRYLSDVLGYFRHRHSITTPFCNSQKRNQVYLTTWLGDSIYHIRLQGYIPAGLVSSRLFTHNVRIDSASRKAEFSISLPLGLHHILFHLFNREPDMWLCTKQYQFYRGPCSRRHRGVRRRQWRVCGCSHCFFRKSETHVTGHMQQLLCFRFHSCPRYRWCFYGESIVAMVFLGQPSAWCSHIAFYALLLQTAIYKA